MDVTVILRDLLLVLFAAKVAAELSERIGVPPVVGEIVAGLVIGPSMLGLVGNGDEVLRTVGEIGVILLLVEVGMEMDIGELGKVGRASMSVATIGVVVPLLLGLGAMEIVGDTFNTSLFVAAALTATSVGITARVFGDLRALATTEARVVLGAAVADDVMGLVVLTVVVRLVTQGSVSMLSVVGIVAVALGFLIVGGGAAMLVAPKLFDFIERQSRSAGTLVAMAMVFTLGMAELASLAKLATIVGAFLAGLAFSRTRQNDRIHRELASVGNLFIPVFFVQIGLDADISAFGSASVLRDAGILLVVAIIGKLVAAFGARKTRGDGWLIGLGMLPRGEVGLIFATIGLQNGVLGEHLYASLLLVVLVTTLMTPPLLKVRYNRLRSRRGVPDDGSLPVATAPPTGGWFWVDDGVLRLSARPSEDWVLAVAFDAAIEASTARPSTELLEFLHDHTMAATWDARASAAFRRLITLGTPRSWHFLEAVGILDVALPELAETFKARYADPLLVDARHAHRFATLERVRALPEDPALRERFDRLAHPEWLLLAALLVEGLRPGPERDAEAAEIAKRAGFGSLGSTQVVGLVADDSRLRTIASRPEAFDEEEVLQLASHLDNPERARAGFLLAIGGEDDLPSHERDRMLALHDLVQRALSDPSLTGSDARNLIERRRTEAMVLAAEHPALVQRIRRAPRSYLARQQPETIVRHAELTQAPLEPTTVRVDVGSAEGSRWRVEVGARNRPGLMATVTGVLHDANLNVERALVATWGDDAAIESFVVSGDRPAPEQLATEIADSLGPVLTVEPISGARVTFNDIASPWHTVCEVTCPDTPGLLHTLTSVFAAADVEIKAASIDRVDGIANDRFEVTGRNGARLTDAERERIRSFLSSGVSAKPRRFRSGYTVKAG